MVEQPIPSPAPYKFPVDLVVKALLQHLTAKLREKAAQ